MTNEISSDYEERYHQEGVRITALGYASDLLKSAPVNCYDVDDYLRIANEIHKFITNGYEEKEVLTG